MIASTSVLSKGSRISLTKPITGRSIRLTQGRSMKESFWALDFDGVICDSCGESSLSAWKAAAKIWPNLIEEATLHRDEIMNKMRTVRPVVETGFENIVQIRCLIEGVDPENILSSWSTILPDCMTKWSLDRDEMVDLFGSTRDNWMKEDLESWLAPNKIFPGLSESMPKLLDKSEVYIVTTKQERFTHALLKDMAKIDFPMERILSTTISGQPKTEILADLQSRYDMTEWHFIEDKLSTLDKVCSAQDLDQWQLYLADWGYNTEAERRSVSDNPRITLISLDKFNQLIGGEIN